MKQFAVMGNPIAHSRSPDIHQAFAAQTGVTLGYEKILVDTDGFGTAVKAFGESSGCGLNITLPFKHEAFDLATELSERATQAGAVNTLHFRADGLYGDNTDGAGLVRDITENNGINLTGSKVLLLGAGGASRGVIGPILAENPANLFIANRTAEKARQLATLFANHGSIGGGGYADIGNQAFDIIINGTAASINDEVPPLPDGCLDSGGFAYDMMYKAEPTAFAHWAIAQGAGNAVDGLGMLVEQAAESFLLWHGVRPDSQAVISALGGQNGTA